MPTLLQNRCALDKSITAAYLLIWHNLGIDGLPTLNKLHTRSLLR